MVLLDNLIIFLTNLASAGAGHALDRYGYSEIASFWVIMKIFVLVMRLGDCRRNVLTTYFYSPFI